MRDQLPAPAYHPRPDDHGKRVKISQPTAPSPRETWKDPTAVAVFVPDGPVPEVLNGLALAAVRPPSTEAAWANFVKQPPGVRLPPLISKPGKKPAAGAVIVEMDGRVWLVEPTNHYGGHKRTFPKGKPDKGKSLEAIAAKEAFEETGLLVEIGAFLADREGDTSITRFFLARRVGGTPSGMGWETQAVWLVPLAQLKKYAPHRNDARVVQAVVETMQSGG